MKVFRRLESALPAAGVCSTQAAPASHGPSGVLSHRLAAAWKTKQKIAASGEGLSLGRCLVRNSRD